MGERSWIPRHAVPNPTPGSFPLKLTPEQVAAIKRKTGADPIESDNAAMESLISTFGDHTFYLFDDGLLVPAQVNDPDLDGEPIEFICLAQWASEAKDALKPVEPEPTGFRINLASDDDDED